ncbi:MAG: DEAD/DEAH box helicase [Myxococcales bacterium]|nr:DEAD/DEAH box helicase [Myxococcales bacterium]
MPPKDRPIDRISFPDRNPPTCLISFIEEQGRYIYVRVPIELNSPFPRQAECEACSGPCVHQLMAVEELLSWLANPAHPRQSELLKAAETQAWTRWLEELDDALDLLEQSAQDQQQTTLWWNVDVDQLIFEPYVVRPNTHRKPQKIRLDKILNAGDMADCDQAVFSSVRWHRSQQRAAKRAGNQEEIFVHTLATLMGHPRVSVGVPGGLPWKIRRVQLNVSVCTSSPGADMVLHVGSHLVCREEVQNRPDRPRFFVSKTQRTIDIFLPSPAVAKFIRTWAHRSVPIPSEQLGALNERLTRLYPHVSISSDVSIIRDETICPCLDAIALLSPLQREGLHIEFRIRPIPHGPILKPGTGREDLVSLTNVRDVVRTTRDLHAERTKILRIAESMDLSHDHDKPFHYTISKTADAIEIVKQLRLHPEVECQWPSQKWHAPALMNHRQLRITLEKKNDWLEIHGGAHLEQQRIDLAVLIQAAQRDRGYIPLKDGQFLELESTLRQQLSLLSEHLEPHRNRFRVLHHGLSALKDLLSEVPENAMTGQWQQYLENINHDEKEPLEPPKHLQEILRPYQIAGFRWLSRLARHGAGAILADDMGLGKTLQMIAVLLQRASIGPQIVISPTSVVFNWARELQRYAPNIKVLNYTGAKRRRILQKVSKKSIVITSYGIIQREFDESSARARDNEPLPAAEDIRKISFSTLVVDEAQLIKNPHTRRAQAIYKLDASWKVALTGTPIENSPAELWSIFHAIFPSLLGSFDYFRTRYLPEADVIESFANRPQSVKGARPEQLRVASHALKQTIQPYILRRTKQQVARELPPRTEMVIDIELSLQERALYDDARLAAIANLRRDDVVEQTNMHIRILAALTRLRQLACHPRLVDPSSDVRSSKMERILQVIHELLTEERRALVFSQFTKHLGLLREQLDLLKIPYIYLDGQTPTHRRSALVDEFQTGNTPIFLISLKAGGTGLNLTAADTVIHLDPWWNPAVEDQATDRAHRIGQTQPVTVLRMVSLGTIEQKILDLSHDKRRLVTDLLGGAHIPAQLSSEELAQLIRREYHASEEPQSDESHHSRHHPEGL